MIIIIAVALNKSAMDHTFSSHDSTTPNAGLDYSTPQKQTSPEPLRISTATPITPNRSLQISTSWETVESSQGVRHKYSHDRTQGYDIDMTHIRKAKVALDITA